MCFKCGESSGTCNSLSQVGMAGEFILYGLEKWRMLFLTEGGLVPMSTFGYALSIVDFETSARPLAGKSRDPSFLG